MSSTFNETTTVLADDNVLQSIAPEVPAKPSLTADTTLVDLCRLQQLALLANDIVSRNH
ncbi:MAG: hypothetical protein KAG53_11705 [Endozoicomonadaceae bacterium]|nr:hypothetical protein [Endozoicomonadaceae bacterium]